MLKFGTPTIALPLAIKKCTVQTGCTVYIYIYRSVCLRLSMGNPHKKWCAKMRERKYVVQTRACSKLVL